MTRYEDMEMALEPASTFKDIGHPVDSSGARSRQFSEFVPFFWEHWPTSARLSENWPYYVQRVLKRESSASRVNDSTMDLWAGNIRQSLKFTFEPAMLSRPSAIFNLQFEVYGTNGEPTFFPREIFEMVNKRIKTTLRIFHDRQKVLVCANITVQELRWLFTAIITLEAPTKPVDHLIRIFKTWSDSPLLNSLAEMLLEEHSLSDQLHAWVELGDVVKTQLTLSEFTSLDSLEYEKKWIRKKISREC